MARVYPIKISALRELHDEELFYASVGRSMVDLQNHMFDLERGNIEFEQALNFNNEIVLEKANEDVMPLMNEIEYLKNIIKAIEEEDYSCKFFSHFIENLDSYIDYVNNDFRDWKLVYKLQKQENLLRNIYFKQELEHFENIAHQKDRLEQLKNKFGDQRIVDALHHFVESGFGDINVVDELNKRIARLDKAAKWAYKKILKDEIKRLRLKFYKVKKKSSKLLNDSNRHYKKVSSLHDELLR